ncbi:MAG: DUF4129 domain-containing protein [Gaiellaceae bacterium]
MRVSVSAKKRRARPALLVLAVAALVFLVALGSSRSLDRVGGVGAIGPGSFETGSFILDFLLIGAVLVVVAFVCLVYALWGDLDAAAIRVRPPRRWWTQLLAVVQMVVVFWLVVLAVELLRRSHRLSLANINRGRRGLGLPAQPATPHPTPSPHWWPLAVLATVALVASLALLLRRRPVRAPRREPPASGDQLRLRAAIDVSLEELEQESDPRRAVVRAYVGMEQSLERQGLPRRPSETPLEHLARSLAAVRVSSLAGERLIALFERARFSQHTIGLEMKQQAIEALVAVRDELGQAQS